MVEDIEQYCSHDAQPLLGVAPCDHEAAQHDSSPSSSSSLPPPAATEASRPGHSALDSEQSPLPSRASTQALSLLSTPASDPTPQTNAERNDRVSCRGSSASSRRSTPRESRQHKELPSALTIQTTAGTRGRATPHSQLATSSSPKHSTIVNANWYAQQLIEMQVLRKEVFVLNERLRVLKHEAHAAQRQQSMEMEGRVSPSSVEGMSMAQLWEPVVERQRQRLEHAQCENVQLKKRVRYLKKMTKNLWRALLKRANRYAVLTEMLQFPPLYPINLDVSTDDCAIFQKMVVDIDAMHSNVGNARWILQKITRKWTNQRLFCRGKARVDTDMSIFVELASCERVPFQKTQVESALLLLREDEKTAGCQRYNAHHFGGASQLTVTKSKFQHSSSVKAGGIYRARRANRSFVDGAQCSISLAIGYVDPVDVMDKSAPGFLLRILSWRILTEQVRAGQAVETMIQSYSTIAPVLIREPYPFKWDRETVERVVIPEFTRSIAAGSQALENVLIGQASQ